jgi:uncharacterized small protein (DUF1192 family)
MSTETLAAQAPHQDPLEHDVVLSEQESQIANSMELRNALENPDDMRILRVAVEGKNDEKAQEIVDQFFHFKMLSLEGTAAGADLSSLRNKYGEDIVSNIEQLYLNYITMPDEQFEAWASEVKNPVESENETNVAELSVDNAPANEQHANLSKEMDPLYEAEPAKVGSEEVSEQPATELMVPAKSERSADEERFAAANGMLDSLEAFHKKVDEHIFENAELSVEEYTNLVNEAVDAFNKYADTMQLSLEERKARLAVLEKEIDRRKAQLDKYNEELAVRKAEVNDVPEVTEDQPEEVTEEKKASFLRRRWNNLKTRGLTLMAGDIRGALGSYQEGKEGQIITKRRVIGAAALVGIGLLYANNRYSLGLDVTDINPFNNKGGSGSDVLSEAGSAPAQGTEIAQPDLVTVQVDPNEGTSHIARDHLGINFDSRAEWDQFNAKTNSLFEGVDGFYRDAASGEMQVSAAGPNGIPREILDQMQQAAEEIKKSKAA